MRTRYIGAVSWLRAAEAEEELLPFAMQGAEKGCACALAAPTTAASRAPPAAPYVESDSEDDVRPPSAIRPSH